jgi:hypothetical protein
MDSPSIVGRSACHVDSLGGRTGCRVTCEFGDGRVEVKGTASGAVGHRWTCSRESLELIPIEWTLRFPGLY